MPEPSIFFIVGCPRSGTTWLMRILGAHPEIFCTGEGRFFGSNSPWSLRGALGRTEEVQRWIEQSAWTYRPQDPDLDDIIGMLARELMLRRLALVRRHLPSKRVVGDKSPNIFDSPVGEILRTVPEAKVIHVIRDGRDQAVSVVHHRWRARAPRPPLTPEEEDKRSHYRKDPTSFGRDAESLFTPDMLAWYARQWANVVTTSRQEGIQGSFAERYSEVRYEDLHETPFTDVRRLFRFLGVEDSVEIASECIEGASFERLSGRQAGEEDSFSYHRKGVVGDWRELFTAEDAETYAAVAGEALKSFGYDPSI